MVDLDSKTTEQRLEYTSLHEVCFNFAGVPRMVQN